jgi:hypothetical protein
MSLSLRFSFMQRFHLAVTTAAVCGAFFLALSIVQFAILRQAYDSLDARQHVRSTPAPAKSSSMPKTVRLPPSGGLP